MARRDELDDDGTSAGGETCDDTVMADTSPSQRTGSLALKRLFSSCEEDALGSVHKAWAVTVLFMIAFFAGAIVEANKLKDVGLPGSLALEIAAYWSAALHLILAIVGTFILKRFSTSFTVGCFLGVTVVLSQQNLLLFAAFYSYGYGNPWSNIIFADLAFALFVVLSFFSLILGHFRYHVIVK